MSEFKNELLDDTTDKETGLTEKETFFLEILFDESNGDIRDAMKKAGFPKDLTPSSVSKKLQKEIVKASKDYLAAQTAKAAVELVNTMMDPNQPGMTAKLKAIDGILDRGGVSVEKAPVEKAPNVIVLLPSKRFEVEDDLTDIKIIEH